jgi:hypothetical protein
MSSETETAYFRTIHSDWYIRHLRELTDDVRIPNLPDVHKDWTRLHVGSAKINELLGSNCMALMASPKFPHKLNRDVRETAARIARGASHCMLLTGAGELLDFRKHAGQHICSVEISNDRDGKVSVLCREIPFKCAVEFLLPSNHCNDFWGHRGHIELTANKKVHLLPSQRFGDVWLISFVKQGYYLEIRPGSALDRSLKVTHRIYL